MGDGSIIVTLAALSFPGLEKEEVWGTWGGDQKSFPAFSFRKEKKKQIYCLVTGYGVF